MTRSSSRSGASWARASSLALAFLFCACEQGAALGTPCERTPACASPLVCRLGRCRAECNENRDCPLASQCFLDREGHGACQLDVDDACGGGCPDGLECLADACVRSCASPTDCPRDGQCATASGATVGVCVDQRRLEDAGASDAIASGDAGDASDDAGSAGFVSVCVGQNFACAVRGSDGAVLCWGQSGLPAASRLGNGTFDGTEVVPATYEDCDGLSCSTLPVRVSALRADQSATEPMVGASQVVCGGDFACALRDGAVWCWGGNYAGQRGDGTKLSPPYATPNRQSGDRLFSGRQHVCLRQADAVTCWGGNTYGQLARSPSSGENPMITVASGVAHVTLGAYVTCFATLSGEVRCVGWNGAAQLGRPAADGDLSSVPVLITAVDGSRGLGAGTRFVCALDAVGVPRCWGTLERGILGRTGSGFDPVPAPVTGSPTYAALFTGPQGDQTCGQHADGTVACWGDNQYGTVAAPLGAAGTVVSEPRMITALRDATEISFGEGTACAILAGSVVCWGANNAGQLGRGSYDTEPNSVPLVVSFGAE